LIDEMHLLFTVGNLPCIGSQIITFRNGEQQNVCGGNSADATISLRDVLTTFNFSFGDVVGLQFDVNVSGLAAGTTLFTVNGAEIQSSGVFEVAQKDFSVEIFVPKDAPGQVVGDIIIRAAAAIDSDNDDIPDDDDECPDSDLSPTVAIDDCDSGVENRLFHNGSLFGNGCTISDLMTNCAEEASNHGIFVSCVTNVTNDLKQASAISGKEKRAIQRCAGRANIP
jgi:hypothetical protein